MCDEIISFKTAVMAKDKGFNASCYKYYYDEDNIYVAKIGMHGNPNAYGYISAPTQSLLQRWLREIHDIHIAITPMLSPNNSKLYHLMGTKRDWSNYYKTYEKALEEGLQKALTLIKDVKEVI